MKLEDEYKRNINNYQRNLKNYEIKLKDLENSSQEFLTYYKSETEKFNAEIKTKVFENINNKFTIETMTQNIKVLENENETCRHLISEYRNLIDSHLSSNVNENASTTENINAIHENFQEMLSLEMDEKVNFRINLEYFNQGINGFIPINCSGSV